MNERYLIVVAKFNEVITRNLLLGAKEVFAEHNVLETALKVVFVPGCFELPIVAKKATQTKRYRAIVCLGAVIKGETPHFDFVAGEAARGIMDVALETETPIIFGVLTTNTVEQAMNRSGLKYGNKGRDAAAAALQTVKALCELERDI